MITSGKFRETYQSGVEQLVADNTLFHHWEVSIKDFESFEFGLKLLQNGNRALFRYDYLDIRSLKKSIDRFIRHVKLSGMWKDFDRSNRGFEKRLRQIHKGAGPDMVVVEEFNYPYSRNGYGGCGLIFSPLDRSVMRKGGTASRAECSLFNLQYRKAVHVIRDGTLYPCHLPRFKKGCEPLGNVSDRVFLEQYQAKLAEFKEALVKWQRETFSRSGVCMGGCRGNLNISSGRGG